MMITVNLTLKPGMSPVLDYLEAVVTMQQKHCHPPQKVKAFCSLEHFVLSQGKPMNKVTKLPDKVRLMTPKECFRNAAIVAMEGKGIYCEGYAYCGTIPVMHAWCMDWSGRTFDPTWGTGADYFGVAVQVSFLKKQLMKQERYGLIDCPDNGWPLLDRHPKEWMHPVMKRMEGKQ